MSLRGKAAIVGLGELKPTRKSDNKLVIDLCAQAAKLAIEDSGLSKGEIDGLIAITPMSEFVMMWPAAVAEYMQLKPTFLDTVDLGGASAAGSIWRAAAAIDSGLCSTVLCVSGDITDPGSFNDNFLPFPIISKMFEDPYGPLGVTSAYALITQRHMHEFGTTSEQLARVAVAQRFNACANPEALFYGKPISVEDVLNSPLVVDPLHLLEIVYPCSGASAVVVTSLERARRLKNPPVTILGAGECSTHSLASNMPSLTTSPITVSSHLAYEMAGVGPKDINLLSVYDCYTVMVLITLEDAGFCPKGEGGRFVMENDLTYQGNLPCNTHGGQLSWGQPGLAGGMSHVTEAVRQLMGQAGERQVRKADLALVNGNGGIMSEECTLILGRG